MGSLPVSRYSETSTRAMSEELYNNFAYLSQPYSSSVREKTPLYLRIDVYHPRTVATSLQLQATDGIPTEI